MKYQSSFVKCVISFFRTLILAAFICMALSLALSWLIVGNNEWQSLARSGIVRIMTIRSLIFSLAVGAVTGAFLEFYMRRVRIEVTSEAISFFRGKREYAYFPHESFAFGGLVHVDRAEGVIPFTRRYLRIILRHGGREKIYRCYNFNAKTFSAFISQVRAITLAYEQMRQNNVAFRDNVEKEFPFSATVDKTPLRYQIFHINKEHLVRRHRFLFVCMLLFCFLPAFLVIVPTILWRIAQDPWFWDNFRMQPGLYIVLSLLMLIPLAITGTPVLIYGSRFFQIKRSTPQRIEVYPDSLMLDNEKFYLSQMRQIKMTPPHFGDGDTHIKRRFLTITSDDGKREFVISDSRDIDSPSLRPKKEFPKAFAEYPTLYDTLQSAFEGEPNKFISDLK